MNAIAAAILICTCAASAQASVVLEPIRDNTLFEVGSFASAGAGPGVFCGLTDQGQRRRALLAFDVAGALPPDALVTSVSLQMTVTQTAAGNLDVGVHRVANDWGEGTSVPLFGGGGAGAAPTSGDATWAHTFFPGAFWSVPGGDFDPVASATSTVGGVGAYSWAGGSLVADVQDWLGDPNGNHGWLLLSPETQLSNVKRLASRENLQVGSRPQLSITWIVPGTQTTFGEDLAATAELDGAPVAGSRVEVPLGARFGVRVGSPNAGYVGFPLFVIADVYAPGVVPGPGVIPGQICTGPAPIVVAGGAQAGGQLLTVPAGAGFAIDFGPAAAGFAAVGTQLRLQGVVLDVVGSSANGLFASTDCVTFVF